MSPERRELMHQVMDGDHTIAPILHGLTRYTSCDNILKWLVLANITGRNFVDWLNIVHNKSIMQMVKFITKQNHIRLGKDWV